RAILGAERRGLPPPGRLARPGRPRGPPSEPRRRGWHRGPRDLGRGRRALHHPALVRRTVPGRRPTAPASLPAPGPAGPRAPGGPAGGRGGRGWAGGAAPPGRRAAGARADPRPPASGGPRAGAWLPVSPRGGRGSGGAGGPE